MAPGLGSGRELGAIAAGTDCGGGAVAADRSLPNALPTVPWKPPAGESEIPSGSSAGASRGTAKDRALPPPVRGRSSAPPPQGWEAGAGSAATQSTCPRSGGKAQRSRRSGRSRTGPPSPVVRALWLSRPGPALLRGRRATRTLQTVPAPLSAEPRRRSAPGAGTADPVRAGERSGGEDHGRDGEPCPRSRRLAPRAAVPFDPASALAMATPWAPAGALAAGHLRPGIAPRQRHPRVGHGYRTLAVLPTKRCPQGTPVRNTQSPGSGPYASAVLHGSSAEPGAGIPSPLSPCFP